VLQMKQIQIAFSTWFAQTNEKDSA